MDCFYQKDAHKPRNDFDKIKEESVKLIFKLGPLP